MILLFLLDKSGVRKRPQTDFQFPTNISNFLDRLEEDLLPDTFQCEMIGDTSEEDENSSAYDSDYAGYSLSYFVYLKHIHP